MMVRLLDNYIRIVKDKYLKSTGNLSKTKYNGSMTCFPPCLEELIKDKSQMSKLEEDNVVHNTMPMLHEPLDDAS